MASVTKNLGFLVCLLILALDVTAGILGIEAEIAENKVKHVRVLIFECRESSHQAFKLGLAAVVLLSLAHVIAILLGGCVCVWSKADMNNATPNKQLAVASLIFSWITLALAFSMLIIATLTNARPKEILRIVTPSPILHRRHCVFHPCTLHSCLLCICYSLSSRTSVTKV
ncbi:hypothetical protein Patl1_10984 [Pistacia atlantica]|uniref:Uncharacterized protein n=1 Tax=Pistacia atlantica TaxID=434234 RepID=A0ACC1A6Y8_9ROSI|nr:hypothetical protein Patl1_10984 [Pistacia atlantica]